MKCEEFPHRLRFARKARRLTQDDLSSKTYNSRYSICMYERGKRQPSLEFIEGIAEVLGVSPAWLCGWSEEGGPEYGGF